MTVDEAIAKASASYLPATYKRAIQFLAETPSDAEGIAKHLGMTHGSAYKLLMALRELRVICIVDHRRMSSRGTCKRVWGLGTKHANHPPKKTPAERSKKWREKQKVVTMGIWGL